MTNGSSIYPNSVIQKRMFMDFGFPVAALNLFKKSKDYKRIGFTPSESDAAFVNGMTKESYESDGKYKNNKLSRVAIKLIKLFGPHGFTNLRICPRCQNPFMFFTDSIGKLDLKKLHHLYVSDPIPSEYDMNLASKYEYLKNKYEAGKPDELDCPFCGHNVYFKHSFMEMQSVIKFPTAPAVSKVYYDYGNTYSETEHIVTLGYSFPPDDLIENIFLETMKVRKDDNDDMKLSYVGFEADPELSRKTWYRFKEVYNYFERKYYENKHRGKDDESNTDKTFLESLGNLRKAFKTDSIRFNFSGFPNILKRTSIVDIVNFG